MTKKGIFNDATGLKRIFEFRGFYTMKDRNNNYISKHKLFLKNGNSEV
jgi:hypothetical protein